MREREREREREEEEVEYYYGEYFNCHIAIREDFPQSARYRLFRTFSMLTVLNNLP